MNYTQNDKIMQVTNETLVVGMDIGSEYHYARAFDNRGIEYSKAPLKVRNDQDGFTSLREWIEALKAEAEKTHVIVGMEPTGHYWFNLGDYLKESGIKLVLVNPHHVKKSKELDDGIQSKNDLKDPKVIAGLVSAGRYSSPCIPEGVYSELRILSNTRLTNTDNLNRVKHRISRWLSIYFPEWKDVYCKTDTVSGFMLLSVAQMPKEIEALGIEGIQAVWRAAKLRGVGKQKAVKIYEAAKRSIGKKVVGDGASCELKYLLEDYYTLKAREAALLEKIEQLLPEIPYAENLLLIKGVGVKTVAGFIAEVGDIRRFSSPKQLQKLAGLAIVDNSSGKHKGKTKISKRGRKRLRHLLFEVALSLVGKNEAFKSLHQYYLTRKNNPLKKMQSLMAIACKVIRLFFVMLKKGIQFDEEKMLSDIKRPANELAVAA